MISITLTGCKNRKGKEEMIIPMHVHKLKMGGGTWKLRSKDTVKNHQIGAQRVLETCLLASKHKGVILGLGEKGLTCASCTRFSFERTPKDPLKTAANIAAMMPPTSILTVGR